MFTAWTTPDIAMENRILRKRERVACLMSIHYTPNVYSTHQLINSDRSRRMEREMFLRLRLLILDVSGVCVMCLGKSHGGESGLIGTVESEGRSLLVDHSDTAHSSRGSEKY